MAKAKLTEISAVEEELNVDSSSMIDMVFQLLLFFMVSSRLLLNTIDPAITIPVATNAKPPTEHAGRIVIHVYEDGGFAGKNRAEEPLEDGPAITAYITEKVSKMEKQVTPKILLRGDRESIVKNSKEVVQAAGAAAVNTIIFSAYTTDRGARKR